MSASPHIPSPSPQGMKAATLCFLLRGTPPTAVLLGYKKRGFGVDKWAGIGGRIEDGETVVAAACREVREEIGVNITEAAMLPRGVITFDFPHRPTWTQTVHLFVATQWQGDPAESEEMRPAWFALDALPFEQMWNDARYWLHELIDGATLHLIITIGADNATVSSVEQTH